MISVVIPAYQAAHVLPTTLPAVLALEGVDEIVWVDDGSTDATSALLGAAGSTGEGRVRVVSFESNRGRSAARNAGVEAATGDVVVFFDADVEPRPESARQLAAAALADGAVASVARLEPVLADPNEPYQDYVLHHPRGPARDHEPDTPLDWRFYLSGASAVPRAAFEAAGGFPERVPYGEDVAFACRLAEAAPGGLRLADTTVRLHDVGDLTTAVRHAREFGRASVTIREACGRGPLEALRRVRWMSPGAGVLVGLLSSVIAISPSNPLRRRAVRYLLGAAALDASRRA